MMIDAEHYEPPLKGEALNKLVRSHVLPQLAHYFDLLDAGFEDTQFNGQPVFGQGDKFLPGKIAIALAHLLILTPRGTAEHARYLAGCRRLMRLVSNLPNDSWGIYYALMAMNRLRKAGLLEAAVEPDCIERLRASQDWRRFVHADDLRLINLPTNYYGVAFGIARLRMLMGWEDASAADALLEKTLAHYERYSGEFGFSDETEGEGRFDRYSILLVAELCERFIETELEVTPRLKELLAQSARLAMQCANTAGDGFGFGRSVGLYGDTAIIEILATAAYLGVLDAEQGAYAYAHCVRAAAKYLDFWFDPALHSVNFWFGGRCTDGYRGAHRMLGENFSIIHQLISTCELWAKAGYADKPPPQDLGDWLQRHEPEFALTWFARGEYDRALLVRRDRGLVFTLPLINGGTSQHDNNPYAPIPFSPRLIEGRPDSGPAHPQLIFRLELADGSVLLPTSFMQKLRVWKDGAEHVLSYEQPGLNRVGSSHAQLDKRVTLQTEYRFGAGTITRRDLLIPAAPLDVKALTLEFSCFSEGASATRNTVDFAQGRIRRFEIEGFDTCSIEAPPPEALRASTSGPPRTHLRFTTRQVTQMTAPLPLRWSFSYR